MAVGFQLSAVGTAAITLKAEDEAEG